MINKNNWRLSKKYLNYRLEVDQIAYGSYKVEKTYIRYLLEWASECSFRNIIAYRPTFPEYMLTTAQEGRTKPLSTSFVKKTLAAARSFFTWLSDNVTGHKFLKQSWIKTIKTKRLPELPRNLDVVSEKEILAIAASPAKTLLAQRAKASAVFLYLSGMRISAFVSMPIQAVDINARTVLQHPSLGVRTKNNISGTTFLWDIPELISVVLEWDTKIRSVLPSNGLWFAPFAYRSRKIDPNALSVGDHRHNLARKNIQAWLENVGLQYHSPHKFRHGHIQYGAARAKTFADFKAISLNVMHSSIKITDEIYSNLKENEVKKRMNSMGNIEKPEHLNEYELFQKFLDWQRNSTL